MRDLRWEPARRSARRNSARTRSDARSKSNYEEVEANLIVRRATWIVRAYGPSEFGHTRSRGLPRPPAIRDALALIANEKLVVTPIAFGNFLRYLLSQNFLAVVSAPSDIRDSSVGAGGVSHGPDVDVAGPSRASDVASVTSPSATGSPTSPVLPSPTAIVLSATASASRRKGCRPADRIRRYQ